MVSSRSYQRDLANPPGSTAISMHRSDVPASRLVISNVGRIRVIMIMFAPGCFSPVAHLHLQLGILRE
jgi:hypothetical protein